MRRGSWARAEGQPGITSLESLRAMQGTGASSQEEGPTGEVLWGPRSRWRSLCEPHRGGVREGARGGRGGAVANLRRPGVSSPTAGAGERAARVWRREGEGPGSHLEGPRRNSLEHGPLRLRNVGQSGRVPAPLPPPCHEPPHPEADFCATGKKGSPAASPLSPDSGDGDAAFRPTCAWSVRDKPGGPSEQRCSLWAMPGPG